MRFRPSGYIALDDKLRGIEACAADFLSTACAADKNLHSFVAPILSSHPGTEDRSRRSCGMSLTTDKGLGKRARLEVSERLRAYHEAVIRMVEPDSEAFFDRVIQRARAEHLPLEGAEGHASGSAQM
jgi:hypothetical protein